MEEAACALGVVPLGALVGLEGLQGAIEAGSQVGLGGVQVLAGAVGPSARVVLVRAVLGADLSGLGLASSGFAPRISPARRIIASGRQIGKVSLGAGGAAGPDVDEAGHKVGRNRRARGGVP